MSNLAWQEKAVEKNEVNLLLPRRFSSLQVQSQLVQLPAQVGLQINLYIICLQLGTVSRQNRIKSFVATIICRDKHNFVATKVLSLQAYFCHDKHIFVATKHLLPWQKYVCRDKTWLRQTCLSRDKSILSQQKTCVVVTNNTYLSWQNFCRDKNDTYGSSRQW